MSGINWVVTLTICTELNEIELSLWDLSYYNALRELKYAIYDGLEMKLKVTKMIVCDIYIPSMVWWWWWMICPVILCPVSSLISDAGSWKESKKSLKLYCHVLCLLFLFQMVLKWVHSLNVMCDSQGPWNESKIHCVKLSWKNQFPKGSLPWRMKTLCNPMQGYWKESFWTVCAAYKHRVL